MQKRKIKTRNLTFYSDPSHGWLKVPKSLLKKLAVSDKITSHSYMRDKFVYLEGDKDADIFLKAMNVANYPYAITEWHTDKSSQIRSYETYSIKDDPFDEDFYYNTPLAELDFIKLDEDGKNYEIHRKGGVFEGDRVSPSVQKYKATKKISYNPPYLTIR